MPDILSASVRTVLSWDRAESLALGQVQDKVDRIRSGSLDDGNGIGQADQVFHDRRTLPAMTGETLDLLAMTTQAVGVTVPMVFSRVRLLQIENLSTSDWCGLNVGADIANPATHYAMRVGSRSLVTLDNRREGWGIDDGNRELVIANPNNEAVTYEIILIGAEL